MVEVLSMCKAELGALANSSGSFFRLHHKMASKFGFNISLADLFTTKATTIEIAYKTKYGVPGCEIFHLYEL